MKKEVEIKVWMIATLAMVILFVGAGILDSNRRDKQLSQRISELELRRDCTEHPRFRGRPAQIIRIDDSRMVSVYIKFIETDEEMNAWPADLMKPPK